MKKTVTKPVDLNPEQEAVVQFREGFAAAYAGPGSGKSQCLTSRYARLIQEGVSPDQILSLSFTAVAAKNLRDRVESKVGKLSINRTAGAVTFHSLALSFATQEAHEFSFKLAEFPLCPEPVANKLAGDAARRYEIDYRSLRSWVSLQKRFRRSPATCLKDAETTGRDVKLALGYKGYDKALKENGTLDFDSLLYEMVELLDKKPDVRKRWQYSYVMCDESQDCSKIEWELLKLITEKSKNLLAVGDPAQCQPPGTMVLAPGIRSGKRGKFIERKMVPIESLKEGDRVATWWRRKAYTKFLGQKITKTASRHYEGEMLTIVTNGCKTKMTPNHKLWATLAPDCRFQHVVYMMYRAGFGFRIGMCRSAIYKNNRNGVGGFTGRCYEEQADQAWILKVFETRYEAHEYEMVTAARYGVPTCIYNIDGRSGISQETTIKIFAQVPLQRGLSCLRDHNLYPEYPLFDKVTGRPSCRYFQVHACNLIPEMMKVPTLEECSSSVIDSVEREYYCGLVYSLNVGEDHTYIADGIPVCNCIYSFRGSDSGMFENMGEMFPGAKKFYLGRNYRSSPQVVEFIRGIAPCAELAEHFSTNNAAGPEPEIKGFISPFEEAKWVIGKIQESS